MIKLEAQILINQFRKHREIENYVRSKGEENYEGNFKRNEEGIHFIKQTLYLTKYNLNLDEKM